MASHSREILSKGRIPLLIGAIICIFVAVAVAVFFLNTSTSGVDQTNESTSLSEDIEVSEAQNFTSYNSEAIATISGSAAGTSGDMFSHLWFVSGTITNIDDSSGVIAVAIDTSSDYSQYLMSEIYIDNSDLSNESDAYSVGDVVEIRFLPEPEEALIKPTEMYTA